MELKKNNKKVRAPIKLKKEGRHPIWPNIIGIYSYCVLDRPEFEWNQVLLYPELTPWWYFLFADGAHKKPHSPTLAIIWRFISNTAIFVSQLLIYMPLEDIMISGTNTSDSRQLSHSTIDHDKALTVWAGAVEWRFRNCQKSVFFKWQHLKRKRQFGVWSNISPCQSTTPCWN